MSRPPTPAASRIGAAGVAASAPSPRYFQTASVSSAGARPAAKVSTLRRRVKSRRRAGATRKIEFDGLIAIEYPAASPAASPLCQPEAASAARRQKYADTSRATVEGKSGTDDSPSSWGSVNSVYFWW